MVYLDAELIIERVTVILNTMESSDFQEPHADEAGKMCLFRFKIFLGMFYSFCYCVCLLLTNAIIQRIEYMNAAQLSAIRSLWVFLYCLPFLCYINQPLFPKGHRRLLIIRGILSAVAMYSQAVALKYLPLVETTIISSTIPVFMSLFARLYLKEPCRMVQILALIATFCGILLSIRLPEILRMRQTTDLELSGYILGFCFAVLYVFLFSASNVLLGKMKHMHFSVPLCYSTGMTSLINGVISYSFSTYELTVCGLDQWLLISMGVLNMVCCSCMVLAFQVETVTVVGILKISFEIILSPTLQILIFHEVPSMYNLYGGLLVFSSTLIVSASKIVHSLPEGSKNREKFKFLLL